MSKSTHKASKPLTREELIERIKRPVLQAEIDGVGLVKYRRLSAEQRYRLQAFSDDQMRFAAQAIIEGFVEPRFNAEDEALLRDGSFGPVMEMGALVLRDTEITEEDLAK